MANGKYSQDAVQPTTVTAWQLIGSVIVIFAVMVSALWTIVTNENNNNRAIIDELHNNYTTHAQHNDLAGRLDREVIRADGEHRRMNEDLRRLHDDNIPRSEFKAWQEERTKTIDRLIADLHDATTRVETVIRDRASVDSLLAVQRQLDALGKRIDEISIREDQRHIIRPQQDK